ncbi:Pentatricopeptide repeat-containing protein [Platanthera guangdongensis]|uniref:Pentatricopeptide repeat-containing protein n=1 Tax=Platanthera guangdongensis TaxID=2320717 RepID=A0ABR2M2Z8_9ASPA
MQSFICFSPKGASVAAPHLYSDPLHSHIFSRRRKKKKRSGHVDFVGTQIENMKHGFLSGDCNLWYSASKMSFLYPPCAQSPSLVHDLQGHENVTETLESDFLLHSGDSRDRVEVFEKERVDLRALALRLSDARSADDVDEVLKDHDPLPLTVFSSIIRGFGLDKTADPAFAIFDWLKRKGEDSGDNNLSPNLFIYNSILGALKHSAQFEKIDGVIEEMKSKGILPNIVTYNTLMSVYIDQGKHEKALAFLDEIERAGLSPSPATYSSVLLICRKMDDAMGAIGFFVKLREECENGYMEKHPNSDWKTEMIKLENFAIRICYLVMRQHLVSQENLTADVFKVLTEMDKARLSPGRTECERLIWACTRESHYSVAKELYQRIREVENNISLSVCNHVIWLMGKAKKWWAALEVYEDLLDQGPEPNTQSHELIISHFSILLDAAKKKGTWRWGVRLINKMLDRGLKPGIGEWNAVLIACSKASETSAAVEIFKRMVEHGERPTVVSYGALLSALEKGKLYDEALAVWEHMCKVDVKPNSHVYTILASVYIGNRKLEMVDSLIQDMKNSKIEPNVVTFNAIITGCVRNGRSSSAFEWFHRMKIENIKPNEITYEMLIDGFAHDDGKGKLAYEMYLRAMNEGLDLSPKAYDAVLDSCLACGMSIDLSVLGHRPGGKKKFLRIRKDLSEFCRFADVPRRSRPFDSA